ncbi:CdaR family protein [Neptunitalea lumnitzerae]|uniref:YbbR-like protein n=1 Tax=Neptunitalea lumnitzerae TaxID=2965509 RepID=A0ABQ5MK07_9FLAO|nr:YbbR-like domain-containing protein [Neptunitalea sp. Y10]GLB49724.1 hypothetical protein Y10_20920 [Neptunitalea sp. Y10]
MKEKNKKSIKTVIKNKKTATFLVFLGFSSIIWLLIKLSKEYQQNYDVTLKFYETDKQKIITNQTTKTVSVLIKSTGFQLLKYNLTSNEFNIDITDLGDQDIVIDLGNNRYKNAMQRQTFKRSNVLGVTPEKVNVTVDTLTSKEIEVIPTVQLIYRNGYQLSDSVKVSPNFITAYGPSEFLDSLSTVNTEYISLEDVFDDFEKTVKLTPAKNKEINYSQNTVTISGSVERFSEKVFELPVRFINVPDHVSIKSFPEAVKVVCKGNIEELKAASVNDFDLICDYNNIDSTSTFVKTKVRTKPKNIDVVKINDDNFQVLIRKM